MKKPKRYAGKILQEKKDLMEYTDPADIKKLKFIFSTIDQYSRVKNKDINSLYILDVGCKNGAISFPIASLGCKIKAFDINEDSIRYMQALIEQNSIGNLSVAIGDGCTFNDGITYDIVIISEVLEHVRESLKLIENIAKRMKVGSYCIVTVPNGYGPWELSHRINPMTYLGRWDWLRCRIGKSPYSYITGADHCRFYTKNNLVKTFSKFHFKLIGFKKSDTFLSIFKILRKNSLIGKIDITIADLLPYWLVSGWYFVFELDNVPNPWR